MRTSVRGSGPVLLLIECNLRWPDALLDHLAEWATVLVVAPTGFSTGGRAAPSSYAVDTFEAELLGAVDAVTDEMFSVLGYSLSAAFGALLATRCERVTSLVAGGFPLFGSYEPARAHVQDRLDRGDEVALGADPGAARVFWEHLAGLEPGALARPRAARLALFYGSEDALLDAVVGLDVLDAQAVAAGVPVRVLEGADHAGAFARMDELVGWFRRQVRGEP